MMTTGDLPILYVDDDKDIRHIVRLALRRDPRIDLRLASGGAEALALVADPVWRPAVVLLDVMMPDLSGPEVMAAMRSIHGLGDVPFIFVTAMGRQAQIANYRALGAAGVIVKPFDPLTLRETIGELAGL
ncbi:response regulator [Sphingomonas dokdonensis]|uniref:Response regulator SaeR n=1 Tax=Sphingomonas dokdonensis TaxID=344880 RepID=A0A245ZII2_9SPHN|nr:response regulator [Sphingomonas dokdonensis]OWK29533.1 response regulator SaeR [Sphingomonas dokdonensis]